MAANRKRKEPAAVAPSLNTGAPFIPVLPRDASLISAAIAFAVGNGFGTKLECARLVRLSETVVLPIATGRFVLVEIKR